MIINIMLTAMASEPPESCHRPPQKLILLQNMANNKICGIELDGWTRLTHDRSCGFGWSFQQIRMNEIRRHFLKKVVMGTTCAPID